MKSLYLVYDIGTTNIKAAFFDAEGNLIDIARQEIRNIFPHPGWAETKVSHVMNQFYSVTRELLSRYETPVKIHSISVVGNFPSLIFFDKNKRFISDRVILWMDRRANQEADLLWRKYKKPTGPEWPYAKLLWVKRNEPHNFSQISKILQPQDLIIFTLTGNLITAYNNLRVLGFQIEKKSWGKEGEYIGLDTDLVPPGVLPGTPVGYLQENVASILNLDAGIPVAMGCGDADASVIGSGCLEQNDACEITGSSTVYSLLSSMKDHHDLPDPLFVFPHPLNILSVIRGPISSSGLSIDWFRDNFAKEEIDDEKAYRLLFKEAEESANNDLVFLPYLTGKVSTKGYKTGYGVITNLRIEHTRGNIFRSLLNSLALQLSDLITKTQKIGGNPDRILSGGGGSRNDFFLKLKASACDLPFCVLQTHESSLLGAAILAAKGIDEKSSWDTLRQRMIHIKRTIQPDEKIIEALAIYKESYLKVNDQM
jgi:xylulokinase